MPELSSIPSAPKHLAETAPGPPFGRNSFERCRASLCAARASGSLRSRQRISGQAPRKFTSIIGPCAGGSAWIDSDQPSAFFSEDPWCLVLIHLVTAVHRHLLVSVPMEQDQSAFECAPA